MVLFVDEVNRQTQTCTSNHNRMRETGLQLTYTCEIRYPPSLESGLWGHITWLAAVPDSCEGP